jgi:hypothetical protein
MDYYGNLLIAMSSYPILKTKIDTGNEKIFIPCTGSYRKNVRELENCKINQPDLLTFIHFNNFVILNYDEINFILISEKFIK